MTYVWDGRNRLASISDSKGNFTTLQYDSARNLISITNQKQGSVSKQSFVVDSFTNVVSSTLSSGETYAFLTGLGLDAHFASTNTNGSVQFGLSDALGNVFGVTNGDGSLSSQFSYEPFGQTTGLSPASYPFSFSGRVPILNGLIYFRNRYYDSSVGRFISEDPLGLQGGGNFYSYAGDDPVNYNDPLGLYTPKDQMPSSFPNTAQCPSTEGKTQVCNFKYPYGAWNRER